MSLYSQINLQASKTNYERELAAKEEAAEELRRNLTKQVRELEAHLEEERKQRQVAQSAQKKLETELQDMENQLEAEAKGKEDAQRHYKKLHVSYHYLYFHSLYCQAKASLSLQLPNFSGISFHLKEAAFVRVKHNKQNFVG